MDIAPKRSVQLTINIHVSAASLAVCIIVTCLICKHYYVDSTTRPFHQRGAEHLRAAKNPASYKKNALAEHYAISHPSCREPSLKFAHSSGEKDPLRLCHAEAIMIREMLPKLKRKSEGASRGLF